MNPTSHLSIFITGLAMGIFTPEVRIQRASEFLGRDYRYERPVLALLAAAASGEWGEAHRAQAEAVAQAGV